MNRDKKNLYENSRIKSGCHFEKNGDYHAKS